MGLKSTEKKSHYDRLRRKPQLHNAWGKVYENGIKSKSPETRNAILKFDESAYKNIDRISRQLRERKFKFSPAKGVPIPRPGKKARPIIIARIEDRIVKRSILDILQDDPKIQPYFLTPTSFGGIKDVDEVRGVKNAVKMAYVSMNNKTLWYIRSDIQDFFTNIPKEKVLQIIQSVIPDKEFNNLLEAAVNVELENLAELGANKDLFPIYDIGVAQGCCLSPLIGNVLLHDFDRKMNGRGINCLRYIDDFLILGPSQKHVKAALRSASKILKGMGLNAYDPFFNKDKAEFGATQKGFEFLGCEIMPGLIRPSKKSQKRLLGKVDEIISKSTSLMSSPKKLYSEKCSLIQSLGDVSNIIMGWGNQYSFCNDKFVMNNLDKKINQRITKFLQKYSEAKKTVNNDPANIRRLLGVQLLIDCKADPII